ncbi:hypothetical protein GCM10007359_18230 [Rothia aerolata]|uniref:Uncharacterized protein n=1 Tax=Rothia aerolata TaxID=1812262 RepID=A0A917IWH4_9MICC|nr:hypothetical protein GCM10007359_18230 [Rothia aerolata]
MVFSRWAALEAAEIRGIMTLYTNPSPISDTLWASVSYLSGFNSRRLNPPQGDTLLPAWVADGQKQTPKSHI